MAASSSRTQLSQQRDEKDEMILSLKLTIGALTDQNTLITKELGSLCSTLQSIEEKMDSIVKLVADKIPADDTVCEERDRSRHRQSIRSSTARKRVSEEKENISGAIHNEQSESRLRSQESPFLSPISSMSLERGGDSSVTLSGRKEQSFHRFGDPQKSGRAAILTTVESLLANAEGGRAREVLLSRVDVTASDMEILSKLDEIQQDCEATEAVLLAALQELDGGKLFAAFCFLFLLRGIFCDFHAKADNSKGFRIALRVWCHVAGYNPDFFSTFGVELAAAALEVLGSFGLPDEEVVAQLHPYFSVEEISYLFRTLKKGGAQHRLGS
uniref:Uncharacterized protein n=1 Tax=Palpitomonas bilix TaxID=652834 RepID=A0A7S3GI16_9EUKA|mmetsp:Transcript_50098/g.128953  ORF Transcript_50098/g.128953 Transcript_50098/m.128953 type:complete len:328 (+) Transcript_50098:118-1101(+)